MKKDIFFTSDKKSTRNLAVFMFLTLALACLTLSACSGKEKGSSSDGGEKLQIIATIFPEYDWMREILGDSAADVQLTLLLDSGTDMHSYQPTVEDILKIATCDLFVYVGGESDEWVEDALKQAANPDMRVINLMALLGDAAKEEEFVEGMELSDEDDGTSGHDGEDEDDGTDAARITDGMDYDEHVWLSLKNAKIFCSAMADALAQIDPERGEKYRENAAAYEKKLEMLDEEYQETTDAATVRTLLFADRFPFRYLTDDYGLFYYAAFPGCSAETEASFETVIFLASKVDELGLGSILTMENSDQSIAKTVIQNTRGGNQKILTLDSMQSVTSEDISDGVTYLSVMESNLAVLKQALIEGN